VTAAETQPERTALAWQRTGLGVLAVAGLLAHAALRHGGRVLLVMAGLVALLGLGVLVGLGPGRYRQVRSRVATDRPMDAPGPVAAVTVAVVLTAAAAAVAVVMPR
jgi:putative membrane protein